MRQYFIKKACCSKKSGASKQHNFFLQNMRVSRKNLPGNVTIKRKKTIGPCNRCKQKGKGMIGNLFKTAVKLGISEIFNSSIGKKIPEEGIKKAPNIYLAGVKKISNKKIKKALESHFANYTV